MHPYLWLQLMSPDWLVGMVPQFQFYPTPAGLVHGQDIPSGRADWRHSDVSHHLRSISVHYSLDCCNVVWGSLSPWPPTVCVSRAGLRVAVVDGAVQHLLAPDPSHLVLSWPPGTRKLCQEVLDNFSLEVVCPLSFVIFKGQIIALLHGKLSLRGHL